MTTLRVIDESADSIGLEVIIDVSPDEQGEFLAQARVFSPRLGQQVAHWEGTWPGPLQAARNSFSYYLDLCQRVRDTPGYSRTRLVLGFWEHEGRMAELLWWWDGGWFYQVTTWAPGYQAAPAKSLPTVGGTLDGYAAWVELLRVVEELGGQQDQIMWLYMPGVGPLATTDETNKLEEEDEREHASTADHDGRDDGGGLDDLAGGGLL